MLVCEIISRQRITRHIRKLHYSICTINSLECTRNANTRLLDRYNWCTWPLLYDCHTLYKVSLLNVENCELLAKFLMTSLLVEERVYIEHDVIFVLCIIKWEEFLWYLNYHEIYCREFSRFYRVIQVYVPAVIMCLVFAGLGVFSLE